MKDYLPKEEILRTSRNTQYIDLDGYRIQIFPDISQATLERRCKIKEIMSVLQSANISYRWGFPFKLTEPYNGTAYTVYTVAEGKELLFKLGLLEQDSLPQPPSTPHPSLIWAAPSSC